MVHIEPPPPTPGRQGPSEPVDSPDPSPVCRRCRSGCWRPGSGGPWWDCLWWESSRTFRPAHGDKRTLRVEGGRSAGNDSGPDISRMAPACFLFWFFSKRLIWILCRGVLCFRSLFRFLWWASGNPEALHLDGNKAECPRRRQQQELNSVRFFSASL